jgi:hypothetical protein
MNRAGWLVTAFAFSFAMGFAAPTRAQDLGLQCWGLRGGVSMNPDQFHFGVFADAGQLTRQVRFQPGFELGLGNGVRLGAANFDALYLFKPRPWRPYAGGGLGINFIDVTNGFGQGDGLGIEPVLNVVGGIEWGEGGKGSRSARRYLLEARLGLGDTPDFKVTAGLTF